MRTSIAGLTSKMVQLMHTRFLIDRNPDHRASTILAGTGRSGTTWISDVINYRAEYRLIFEPFRPAVVDICSHFNQLQYLRPDNRDRAFVEPVTAILSGRVRNRWTDQFNGKFVSNRRLIKTIRANLLLKWIHVNFPGIRTVLLLRHPCAVALSQLKLGWTPDLDDIFLTQEPLLEDFLNPWREDIEAAQGRFEKYVLLWCVDTYVPLKQFRKGDIHLAFYEEFCENPEQEVGRLFAYLGKEFDHSVFGMMERPSALSRNDSAVVIGRSRVQSWTETITDEQMKMTDEILRRFGLDGIYSSNSPLPSIANAHELMDRR